MDEITYLQQQIASMQRRLAELRSAKKPNLLIDQRTHYDFTITADAGTSCNDPKKGFGMKEILFVPTPPKPWPQTGFSLGAMYIQRGYFGPVTLSELPSTSPEVC